MSTQIVPAASLRSADRLPAAGALLGASNYLICRALSSIGRTIFGGGSDFSLLSGRDWLSGGRRRVVAEFAEDRVRVLALIGGRAQFVGLRVEAHMDRLADHLLRAELR